jgi:integrase
MENVGISALSIPQFTQRFRSLVFEPVMGKTGMGNGKYPYNALSAILIRKLQPGMYADGNCLYLVVEESGTRHWIVRTTINGKRRDIGIGGLRYTSLAEARDKAIEILKSARNGGDPLAEKREKKRALERERNIPVFEAAAREVHGERSKGFRSELHKKQWIGQLEEYVFPEIGGRRIDEIESADVLKILTPIWLRIPDIARRVKQRMQVIFQWAKAAGHRPGDNPVDGIEEVLPKHNREQQHFAALPYADVPVFVESLQRSDASISGRLAFEFLILTASRTNEVIKAKWTEVQFDAKTWTRPAAHMKAKREHRVPLTPRCIEILEAAKKITDGSEFVFPGMRRGQHVSNMVFHATLKRMEKSGFTPHGFRSAFRDWAEEKTNHKRHTIETALAHVVRDKVEAAYLRTVLPKQHRALLEAWARFVAAAPAAKVVQMRG